ncbi:tetratricopeptide repeat protein [Polynucleobacter sp. VK25]|uniref:tetratricopeptide repeat protein n=1 Tax=Polynucleobacter sp. VK25 TaxID=1758398 RepID=UPI001BFDE204|nr:tetratricopeptide repeat protein [Polynucleobacter sp. VK25]QWD68083.1 tetratricopeptide repeat protein [Polynucleobacter sp. VK25]
MSTFEVAKEYFLEGCKFLEAEEFSQAEYQFKKSLELMPDRSSTLTNLSATQLKLKKYFEAKDAAEKAISIDAGNSEAYLNLGLIEKEFRRFTNSANFFDKALALRSDYAEAWSNKGNVLNELKRYDEAMAHFDKALSLKPEYAEAWSNKGNVLNELKRYDEAITHFDKALSLKPDYAEAWSNKGNVLNELKRYDEAMAHFDKALSLKPDYAEAWSNKGNVLNELKRYDEAMAHFDKALAIRPDYAEAWSNKGMTLSELKRYDEAITHFDKALAIRPDYAEAWSNKALLNLFLKKYGAGWEDYDWRLKTRDFQLKLAIEGLALWNGSNSKRLLIFSEQGVGDIIFYASLLRIAKNKVENITLYTDARLLPILSRSFPEFKFVDNRLPLDASLYDAQIPLGSLPIILKINPDMDGRSVPYLADDPLLTTDIKNKFSLKKQFKCGVAWRSNNEKIGKNKSILLSDLNEIFQAEGCEFINLQYGDTQEEIQNLEKNFGTKLTSIEGIDLFKNIDGLLSIIQACDLIVTTSNVTAHLAGALGKTTFLLVPYSAGRIWYWHEEAISSWYPSVTLHSQGQNFEWNGAINNIASKLKNEIYK